MNTLEIKNTLLSKLREMYPDIEFIFKEDNIFQYYLIYKDKAKSEYMKSARIKFIDNLDDMCESILPNEDLSDLVIVYDYFEEIDEIKKISKNEKKIKEMKKINMDTVNIHNLFPDGKPILEIIKNSDIIHLLYQFEDDKYVETSLICSNKNEPIILTNTLSNALSEKEIKSNITRYEKYGYKVIFSTYDEMTNRSYIKLQK